jgi:hypothetical protein
LIRGFLVNAIPSFCFNIKAFQVTDVRGGVRGGKGKEDLSQETRRLALLVMKQVEKEILSTPVHQQQVARESRYGAET